MPPKSTIPTSTIPKQPLADFGAGLTSKKPNANPQPVQHGAVSQAERGFTAASTFLSGCMAISATQFLGAPLKLVDPKFYEAYMAYTKQSFAVLITTMTQWWSPTVVRVSGDRSIPGQLFQQQDGSLQCKFPNRLVMMANHQLYTDWLYLWWIAYTNNMSGYIYIILKESIKKVPIFGWACQFYNFIFLSRNWEHDRSSFEKHLDTLSDPKDPMWLLIFPEGTNLAPSTREKSKQWAKKNGYDDMKHQLLPRSTGLRFCLQKLKDSTPWLYDCTVAYEGIPKGQYGQDVFTLRSSMFEGRPPKSVNMHFRRFHVDTIPINDEHAFEVWLRNRWREKDYLLEHFSRYNRFPEDHKWMMNAQGTAPAKKLVAKPAKCVETQIKSGNWEEFLSIFAPLTAFMSTMYMFYGGTNPNSLLKAIGNNQGKQMEMLTGVKLPPELLEMIDKNGPMIEQQLATLMPQMAAGAPMLGESPSGPKGKQAITDAYNQLNQKVTASANQAQSPYAKKGLAGNPAVRPLVQRKNSASSVSTTSTSRPPKLRRSSVISMTPSAARFINTTPSIGSETPSAPPSTISRAPAAPKRPAAPAQTGPATVSALTPQFKKAWNEGQQLTTKPSNDDLIKMWALGKIAKGEDVPKPGAWDFRGQAKYGGYQKLKGGLTAQKAQAQYVQHVEALKATCGFDKSKAVANPMSVPAAAPKKAPTTAKVGAGAKPIANGTAGATKAKPATNTVGKTPIKSAAKPAAKAPAGGNASRGISIPPEMLARMKAQMK